MLNLMSNNVNNGLVSNLIHNKSHCSTVHFRRITSIYQPTNAHIISHKTHLKHFKTLRHVSIVSDRHQRALFLVDTYEAHLATAPQHIPTQQDMLPQYLVCK